NLRILRGLEQGLPAWFDPALRDAIVEKSRANAFSHRLQHYVIKPFTPEVTNRRVEWSDIEEMVAGIEVRDRFDVVVGIKSGGASIARCVAARLGIESAQYVQYVQSRLWSRLPLHRNVLTSLRYYLGVGNDTHPTFLRDDVDLGGQ